MKFSILTLFPDMIRQGLHNSIIKRAVERGLLEINTVNIRDFTTEKHGKVDDYTYGGGAGMLMQAQPVYDAWRFAACQNMGSDLSIGSEGIEGTVQGNCSTPRTIYVTPQGKPFRQSMAKEFANEKELIILCGHYEGIDERVLEETVTDYISIGDYVLTGGELAAMVIVDAIARLVPGVLGNEESADTESFHRSLLEYPQYSRPEVWHDKTVPEVLLSGNHSRINSWRLEQSVKRTKERRPDLFEQYIRTENLMKKLSAQKRNNIHVIETLRRGRGEILSDQGNEILVYDPSCHLAELSVSTPESGRELLKLVPDDVISFEISQSFMIPVLEEMGFHVDMECLNVCYTSRENLPIRHKDIRPLQREELPYVMNHYEHAGNNYLEERLRKGCLFGIYDNETLAGFIGEHEEGSIGMLFVDTAYRRQGYGESLEAYMINRHRQLGYIPYGQIEPDNTISLSLQEKKGLYPASKPIWWMSIGQKWQKYDK